jgi:hypothetical protein
MESKNVSVRSFLELKDASFPDKISVSVGSVMIWPKRLENPQNKRNGMIKDILEGFLKMVLQRFTSINNSLESTSLWHGD